MVLHKLLSIVAGAGLVLTLAACDESEQGRILLYEKGTYLGPSDTDLTEEQRDELRSRVRLQAGG